MNILVCPDKFKGSLTAREVCEAVRTGLLNVNPETVIDSVPLADGGEGTCALLTELSGGRNVELQVHGPLFSPVNARYGISKTGDTAFIEMAEASGLSLLKAQERNPLFTSSFGTGEMIADALDRKVEQIILGVGGSATNDAGIGMAAALGYSFCDVEKQMLKPTGENLIHIHHIRTDRIHKRLKKVRVVALCDVTNPLFGPEGAAFVYGPQKGADKSAVELLDAGLRNFRRIVHKYLKTSVDFPGAGAAGGLGAGARVFLNATMQKGVNYFIEVINLPDKIKAADLIITGEGKIDEQTFSGKVVSEVLKLAARAAKPVVGICGISEVSQQEIALRGMKKVISLVDDSTSTESAVRNAARHITRKIMAEYENSFNL